MNKSKFHDKQFDTETQCKLSIYRGYLREWLPVFLHAKQPLKIQIFDVFAGPGQDVKGNPGSPRIAAQEITSALNKIQSDYRKFASIALFFNEKNKSKFQKLQMTVTEIKEKIPEISVYIKNTKFDDDLFDQMILQMQCQNTANLVFLDPYGISALSKERFLKLIELPRTDLLFFCASSICNRMKKHPNIINKIPNLPKSYEGMTGENVHETICKCYKDCIPQGKRYYLGQFSIKRNGNTNGLIFGSGHPLGIEKFLQVVWAIAPEHGGKGNFDIDHDAYDINQPFLFDEFNRTQKERDFDNNFENKICSRFFNNNHDVYIYAIENSVLPRHAKNSFLKMVAKNLLPKQNIKISIDALKHESIAIQYYNEMENSQPYIQDDLF